MSVLTVRGSVPRLRGTVPAHQAARQVKQSSSHDLIKPLYKRWLHWPIRAVLQQHFSTKLLNGAYTDCLHVKPTSRWPRHTYLSGGCVTSPGLMAMLQARYTTLHSNERFGGDTA